MQEPVVTFLRPGEAGPRPGEGGPRPGPLWGRPCSPRSWPDSGARHEGNIAPARRGRAASGRPCRPTTRPSRPIPGAEWPALSPSGTTRFRSFAAVRAVAGRRRRVGGGRGRSLRTADSLLGMGYPLKTRKECASAGRQVSVICVVGVGVLPALAPELGAPRARLALAPELGVERLFGAPLVLYVLSSGARVENIIVTWIVSLFHGTRVRWFSKRARGAHSPWVLRLKKMRKCAGYFLFGVPDDQVHVFGLSTAPADQV